MNQERSAKASSKDRRRWKVNNEKRDRELSSAKIQLVSAVGAYIRDPCEASFEKMKKVYAEYNNRYLVGRKKT